MPEILLYIPCFNGAPTLPRVLEALTAMRRPAPTRIIVIDDGSTDATAEIARSAGVEVVTQPQNLGLARARNRGLDEADGAFVASIDADVVVTPDWLEVLYVQLIANPQLGGVGGKLIESITHGVANAWRTRHAAQNWGDAPRSNPPHLFGANTIFRTQLLRDAGGYNPRYRTNYEDVDLCHRLRARGVQLAYNPAARCFHLRSDDVESLVRQQAGWFQLRPQDASWPRRLVRTVRLAPRLGKDALGDLAAGELNVAALAPRLYVRHLRNLVTRR